MSTGPEQGSPQWVKERIGKLTASRMADVLARTAKGQPTAAYETYFMQLLAERMTDTAADHYVTAAMQWGIDHEPYAAARYEEETGSLLLPAPFFNHPSIENFGASPDRLLDHDGLVEIKCPSTAKFLRWRMEGVVPEEHRPQMLAQLACTGRRYVDFVAYDPRIQAYRQRIFIRRFEPSPAEIGAVEQAAREFLALVDKAFEKFFETEAAQAAGEQA